MSRIVAKSGMSRSVERNICLSFCALTTLTPADQICIAGAVVYELCLSHGQSSTFDSTVIEKAVRRGQRPARPALAHVQTRITPHFSALLRAEERGIIL